MRKQKKGKRVMAALVTAVFVLGSLGGCAKTQGDRGTEQDAASGPGAGDAAIKYAWQSQLSVRAADLYSADVRCVCMQFGPH